MIPGAPLPIDDLSPAELAALLHFHADAGVEWLLEDVAIDRFAEFAASRNNRPPQQRAASERGTASQPSSPVAPVSSSSYGMTAAKGPSSQSAPAARKSASAPAASSAQANVALPDDQAIAAARFAAETARSLAELKVSLESFTGCNLKNSARHTIFAEGSAASGIMVVGPMPDADDDREGQPFTGKTGLLLDRMLAAIGLDRADLILTNVVPWRPPGNRPPSGPEMEICRPFIERQIALAEPKALLLLGNFTARFFFGGTGTIHTLRGRWHDVAVGERTAPAIATLHPQELINAPASKSLAWQDLLAFQARLRGA